MNAVRSAGMGMVQRAKADKVLTQLKGSNSAALGGGGRILEADQKHPDCRLCDRLKEQIQKDKKNFFLESEHVRGAVAKCLDLLSGHVKGHAYDEFAQSLQLDVRYIGDPTEHHKSESSESPVHDSGGGNGDGIEKWQKRLERMEETIAELEAENLRLSSELRSQPRSSMMPATKRTKVAEKEVQTEAQTSCDFCRSSASFTKQNSGTSRHTIAPESFSPKTSPRSRGGRQTVHVPSNKSPTVVIDSGPASPRTSFQKSSSTEPARLSQTLHSSAIMTNMAKSVGISDLASPPGRSSLWSTTLSAIKEKKKTDEKALLEKLQQQLAEALERAKQLEAENKEITSKLRSTEDELKAKSKALDKAESKLKLAELKSKRQQQARLGTPNAALPSPASAASISSPPASRSDKRRTREQSLAGSDEENQASEAEDFADNPVRPMPVKGTTGCMGSRTGTPATPATSAKRINTAGKVYDKHSKSAPQLASLGKAVPKTFVPFENTESWVEPYLDRLRDNPKAGGPFIHIPHVPFVPLWNMSIDGAKLSAQTHVSKDERRPASSAGRLTPLDGTPTGPVLE
eukprot:gnl/MRDRNA2_/MRDRNA2_31209_c0_seq1.p1 gnl/MRDRNA2_/MRDRNA2_31209_c0~~gnl/MRDRNA2_/MRDRNA2_31209_c0_seq1.p1  ORF type:complete len:574 (+),score=126.63 gnl/MRDRNA2_/MRDRNA2_31209_c0_seq1:93-1814(+)